MALGYFGRFDVAGPLLERLGETPTPSPWEYFGNPSAVFLDFRRQAGLSPSPN